MVNLQRRFFIFFILFFVNLEFIYSQDLKVYPFPVGLTPAKDFTIKINGRQAFVYDSPVGAFVHFESSKPVKLEITIISLDVKRVDIRPTKYNIQSELNQDIITVEVPPSVNLSIELNGNITRPLFIFANAPDQQKPDPMSKGVHYFRSGKIYEVGPVELKDNEQVYIEG